VKWLHSFADYVEPVKRYSRGRMHQYTQQSPLNRLVDAARPESLVARDFNLRVDRVVAGKPQPDDAAVVRATLANWRDLMSATPPAQFLDQEVVPIASQFSTLGGIGVTALDALQSGRPTSDDWRKLELPVLEDAKKPQAEVLIMVVPAIEKLINASSGVWANVH